MDKKIVDAFHIEFEREKMYEKVTWLGIPVFKLPMDLRIMQELIIKVRPDYVIETGTAFGGSALFFASILELLEHGEVLTFDIQKRDFLTSDISVHLEKRITRFLGDSTSLDLWAWAVAPAMGKRNIVFLDSWHSKEHVLKELRLYETLVQPGSYIIVEDTHVSGHPVPWKWGEGPYEAVQEFLKENHNFVIDTECEKLGCTYNPSGYLRRI